MPPSIESSVYTFEGLLPDLESPPIAARRALDHAGLRLSVEGWRSLPVEDRQRVTVAGVAERVDGELVTALLRRASPGAQRISPVSDPDPATPPEALAKALEPSRAIDPKRWAKLRAVDRYALAHTYRRAVARSAFSILGEAFDAVLAASAPPAPPPSPPPAVPYQPAGYYSSSTPAEPAAPAKARPSVDPFYDGSKSRGQIDTGIREAAYEGGKSRGQIETGVREGRGYGYTPVAPSVQPESGLGVKTAPPGQRAYATDPPAQPSARGAISAGDGDITLPRGIDPGGRGFATFPPPPGALSNHLNKAGEVHMVDVARKPKTERRAVAHGTVHMRPETLGRLLSRDAPKGEVLATARVAAVVAAKRTHEIIPLCHMVALTHLDVAIEVDEPASAVHVTAVADAYDRTGCEMEAMVAVSTACLTIYDMLKGIDRDILITDVKLMEKSGGRSGHYRRSDFKP